MLYHLLKTLFEGRHYAYENPLFRGTVAGIFCFIILLIVLPRFIRKLMKWKIGDRPEFDHAALNQLTRDNANVPTMGGIMMLAAIAF